jgi:glycosyltransferase involved in cell wall biosynthesis
MKNNKTPVILFDYTQKEINKSFSGNLIHSYYLSKYISKKINLYGLRPNSTPTKISEETNTKFFTHYYINNKFNFINHIAQFLFAVSNHKKIDLIYSRYAYSWKQYGLIYKILTKKPLIIEVNGVPWDEEKSIKYNTLFRFLYLYPIRKADKILFVSESIKLEFEKYCHNIKNKSMIVRNGIDKYKFKINNKVESRIKYEHSINTNDYVITFVGAIEKWQGLDILVEVAEHLSKKDKKIKFIIVGDGRHLHSLKDKVSRYNVIDFFIFTGAIEQKKVVDYINVADICIAPFVKERKASPIKILEYMACGKMVISSKIPDVLNLKLDEGIIYFEPENSTSLHNKILSLINKKEILYPPNVIRQLVLNNYTWENVARNVYVEVKNEIVSR